MSRTRTLSHTIEESALGDFERTLWTFLRSTRSAEPDTLYQVYQLEDGCSFLHFATFMTQQELEQHMSAPYTVSFMQSLRKFSSSESSAMVQPIAS